MKNLLQLMGALSRDMLFMQGHITSLQGLDAVTPPVFRRRADGTHAAATRTTAAPKPMAPDKACCC